MSKAPGFNNKYEAVIMRWSANHGLTVDKSEPITEQVHRMRLLFVEIRAVMSDSFTASILDAAIETMNQIYDYAEIFGPNPDGSEGKIPTLLANGNAVNNWLNGIEQRGDVIGSSEKELTALAGLLGLLSGNPGTPFAKRLLARLYNTVHEANHLLKQHGFLIDEPHMFSAFNPENTVLVINPSWMDWITKRTANQEEQFVRTTISTSVMHELKNSLLTPELLEAYAIEVEVDLRAITGRVVLTRKPSGLQEAINKYMKG